MLGAGEKVVDGLVLIATVEYSRQARCFRVVLEMAADQADDLRLWPSQCMAATTSRLRRWK